MKVRRLRSATIAITAESDVQPKLDALMKKKEGGLLLARNGPLGV